MSIYDFTATNIDGDPVQLSEYRGKVILVVNTASKCGFTPQYEGLEHIYRTYRDQGLMILGFPCNQFGKQEPGDAAEIREFCNLNYDVTFPMFAKIDVNGENAHPLYRYLRDAVPGPSRGEEIKWNFAKFLIDRSGDEIRHYAPADTPESLESDIVAALEKT